MSSRRTARPPASAIGFEPIPLFPLDEGLRVLFPYPLLGRRSAIRAHERDNLALVAQQQIPQRLKGAQTAVLSAGTAPRMERPPIGSTYPDPSRDRRVHAVASAAHARKNQWLILLKRGFVQIWTRFSAHPRARGRGAYAQASLRAPSIGGDTDDGEGAQRNAEEETGRQQHAGH
jgi:hypothetical protein